MDRSRPRPIGVSIIAILFLAIAILSLLIAARYIINPASNEEMILLFSRLKIPVAFLNLLAIPPLISAGLATLLFRGLWEEQNWARVAVVIFSFLVMLTALALIAFFQVFSLGTRAIWLAAGGFVISAFIFIYFFKIPWSQPSKQMAVPAATPGAAALEPQPMASPPASFAPASVPPPPQIDDQLPAAPTIMLEPEITQAGTTVRIAPQKPVPLACLVVLSGPDSGQRFEIFADDVYIGRHPALVDVLLTDPTVSARHARIQRSGDSFIFTDLNSTNGSYIHEQRVQTQTLHDQDRIWLGAVELLFTTNCQD